MSDSHWQPPADGEPDRSAGTPPPPPAGPDPAGEANPPSPWSPEGAPAPGTTPAGTPHIPPPSIPPPTPPPASPTPEPGHDPVVAPEAPTAEPERRRSKLVVAAAVVAVAALGLAGLFAVQRFSGEAAGGAANAEELGFDLLAAIEAEDVLGVIDTMLPGERDSLGDPFVEMVGELQRLEILSADTDLSHLLGLDVELTDEVVRVSATNVADIVNVSMEADAEVTVDGATLPIGAFVEDQLPPEALDEIRGTRTTERDQLAFEFTAVQDGDRWYFSVFHTVAELIRAEAGDAAIPAEGVTAEGGDSPEAAVDRMLDHIEQFDLRGIIATLDPAEAAALQRYAPIFLDDAEEALTDVPLDWRIDVREFRVEGDGGERTLFIDSIGVSGEADGSTFSAVFGDGCVRAEFDGESFEECGASGDEQLESLFADAPAIEEFTEELEAAFADLEPVGIELRERDGAWYLSPLATGSEAFLALMRALDRSELDALVESGSAAADEFFEMFLGGFALDSEFPFDDEFGFEDEFDEGFDEGAAAEQPVVPTDDPWDVCLSESSAADASACFERAIADGEIDEFSVPPSLMHPECGLAELTWDGSIYDATDAEFAAALEVAVPCFDALVDAGELDEWMVPFEVQHADCFEGRNWYAEYEDDAYNERVDACLAEND